MRRWNPKFKVNDIVSYTSKSGTYFGGYSYLVFKILEVRKNMSYCIEIIDTNFLGYKIGNQLYRAERDIPKEFILDNYYKLKKLIENM
jgi:hypothetical protein